MSAAAMARDLRLALDPVAFAVEELGFQPDEWQCNVLREPGKRILLNCSRQAGKSTTTSIIALHTAKYRPGSLILLVSPTLRQSKELFAKVALFMRRLKDRPKLEEDNKLSFIMPNGSRVVSLPGSAETIRGFSGPALVIEDEAAFVEDALYRSVRPMLATSNGKLILMSTPYGRRGHFYEAWNDQVEDWKRIEVKAQDCPRIPDKFLEGERAALGEWWFRQEYGCEFLETADQIFKVSDINRSITDDVKPLFSTAGDSTVAPLFQ
jgi:hypothetical protein